MIRHNGKLVDVFRLKLEDGEFLPLNRIGKDLIKHSVTYRNDKWFIADSSIDIVTPSVTEGEGGKGMFASCGFSGIFGGKRAQSHLQLRFIESVLGKIGSNIVDKSRYLFVFEQIDQPIHFAGIGWLIVPVSYRPSFAFPGQSCLALSRCLNGNPIKNICIDPYQVSIP